MRVDLDNPKSHGISAASIAMALLLAAMIAAFLTWPRNASGNPPRVSFVEPAPIEVPVWRPLAQRAATFDLDAPRWRASGMESRSLRRSDGLIREVFTFGEATAARRYALVVIDRGPISGDDVDVHLAEIATALGVPAFVVPADGALDTKFGVLPTADMAIDGVEGRKACLGFSHRVESAHFRLSGWVCSPGPEIVDRREATCLVDRVMAVSVGDPAVAAIFASAELRRQHCGAPQAAVNAGVIGHFIDQDRRAGLRLKRL